MTHAPKFWADKLPEDKRDEFWELVKLGFSGETAFCRLCAARRIAEEKRANG